MSTDYFLVCGSARTRSEKNYIKLWTERSKPTGRPASVQDTTIASARLRCVGPNLATGPQYPRYFWAYLERQGGAWMWEDFKEQNKGRDLTWLVGGVTNGTLEWCADGSYHRIKASNISGA